MSSPEIRDRRLPIQRTIFLSGGCLDAAFSMSVMLLKDGYFLGTMTALPFLGQLATAHNLEHPLILRGSSRFSDILSTTEGSLNLLSAGLMYQGITTGQPEMWMAGFTIAKIDFLVSAGHTFASRIASRFQLSTPGL